MEKLDRITINPDVCLGQPAIRGMRITVSVILKMLAGDRSIQEVLEAYPELKVEDIQQAVQYAAWVVSDQIQMVPAWLVEMASQHLLADMNLSPLTVKALRREGWDVIRVKSTSQGHPSGVQRGACTLWNNR